MSRRQNLSSREQDKELGRIGLVIEDKRRFGIDVIDGLVSSSSQGFQWLTEVCSSRPGVMQAYLVIYLYKNTFRRTVRSNQLDFLFVDDSESEGEGDNDAGGPPARTQYSDEELEEKLNDPKLGAKKRAKLEAKAEKRAQREADERMREERKAKQAAEMRERELYVVLHFV